MGLLSLVERRTSKERIADAMEEYLKELRYQTADGDVAALVDALKRVSWNAAVHPSIRKLAERSLKELT